MKSIGMVNSWDNSTGRGVIVSMQGHELAARLSDVVGDTTLEEGQEVSYVFQITEDGLAAVKIQVL